MGLSVELLDVDATPCYWSLRFEGPSSGQFVVAVLPVGSDGPLIKIDL